MKQNITIHKESRVEAPRLSIILLDWSCREHFQALKWLNRQDVDRQDYELIWVELFDRVVPEAMENADAVITCGQQGLYHKHLGYNIGVLHAKGELVTVCDSDAIFPENFISSIFDAFHPEGVAEPNPLVLMHHQWRSPDVYPEDFDDLARINDYRWAELWPNAGACMTVSMRDLLRYGGFDEDETYRGYLCGPYDLGWRMVNAGIPEVWHDESVALWHFSHPDPPASYNQKFSWKMWREMSHPHIDHHALTAVEAFSTGRMLPLTENQQIFSMRMARRVIGSEFEEKYSHVVGQSGFSRKQMFLLYLSFSVKPLLVRFEQFLGVKLKQYLGDEKYMRLRMRWRKLLGKDLVLPES